MLQWKESSNKLVQVEKDIRDKLKKTKNNKL